MWIGLLVALGVALVSIGANAVLTVQLREAREQNRRAYNVLRAINESS